MALHSLPFDVLLAIYRKLDTRDVVHFGMTCTALYKSTKDHHVWLDQLQNCVTRNPVLARGIPPLHSLSVEELRRYTAHQEKLRIRWGREHCPPEQFTDGPGLFDGRGSVWLMVGGRTVLFMSERGKISLHHIHTDGERWEMSPFVSYTLEGGHRWVWATLVSENTTSPLLACREESNCSVQLVSIYHELGVIRLEATIQIPKEKVLVRLVCQGRIVACMLSPGGGVWSLFIIHLDSLKTTVEAALPESPHASFVCLPCQDVVVIYNQFDIACYRLADPSTMGAGDRVLTLTPLWICPNPLGKTSLIYHISLIECGNTPQLTSSTFEARFVEYIRGADIDTFVSWKIGSLGSSVENLTVEKVSSVITLPDGLRCFPASTRNHFWSAIAIDDGISFFITPLDDVGQGSGWGTLRFYIPYREFRDGRSAGARVMYLDLDIDLISGRVIIWWTDEACREHDSRTRFFILELVQGSHRVTRDHTL